MLMHFAILIKNAQRGLLSVLVAVIVFFSFYGCWDSDNPFNPQNWDLEAEAAEIPWEKLTGKLLYVC